MCNKTFSDQNKATGSKNKQTKQENITKILEKHQKTNDSIQLIQEIPSKTVENQLHQVLDAVIEVDKKCDFIKCKTKTNLVGQDCDHCRKRFCMKHTLPEIHGCGDAVKKDERAKFLKPIPYKTIRDRENLEKCHTKLEQKLKDMNLSRKAKPASTKSKSKK